MSTIPFLEALKIGVIKIITFENKRAAGII